MASAPGRVTEGVLVGLLGAAVLAGGIYAYEAGVGKREYKISNYPFGLPLLEGEAISAPGGPDAWNVLLGIAVYKQHVGEPHNSPANSPAQRLMQTNGNLLWESYGSLERYINRLSLAERKLFMRRRDEITSEKTAPFLAALAAEVAFVPNIWWARQHLAQMPFSARLRDEDNVVDLAGYLEETETPWDSMPEWIGEGGESRAAAERAMESDLATLAAIPPTSVFYLVLIDRLDRVATLLASTPVEVASGPLLDLTPVQLPLDLHPPIPPPDTEYKFVNYTYGVALEDAEAWAANPWTGRWPMGAPNADAVGWLTALGGSIYGDSPAFSDQSSYNVMKSNANSLAERLGSFESWVNSLPLERRRVYARRPDEMSTLMPKAVVLDRATSASYVPNVFWMRQHLEDLEYGQYLYASSSRTGVLEYRAATRSGWENLGRLWNVDGGITAESYKNQDVARLDKMSSGDAAFLILADRVDREWQFILDRTAGRTISGGVY